MVTGKESIKRLIKKGGIIINGVIQLPDSSFLSNPDVIFLLASGYRQHLDMFSPLLKGEKLELTPFVVVYLLNTDQRINKANLNKYISTLEPSIIQDIEMNLNKIGKNIWKEL